MVVLTYGEIADALKSRRDFISLIGNGLTPRTEAILGLRVGRLLDAERALAAKDAEIAKLREALAPFSKAGQVIDGPFGPALFAEDDMAFQSGCAWSENGDRKTITWGDFRRARAALEGGAS